MSDIYNDGTYLRNNPDAHVSDTFFKFGAAKVKFENDTGNRFVLGVGKTLFLARWLGLRVCVDYGYMQTIVNEVKSYKSMALVEAGLVFYL